MGVDVWDVAALVRGLVGTGLDGADLAGNQMLRVSGPGKIRRTNRGRRARLPPCPVPR
jgi:hypothetical protein